MYATFYILEICTIFMTEQYYPTTLREWIFMIERQINLSDYGENTLDLNTLYYEFYNWVSEHVEMVKR